MKIFNMKFIVIISIVSVIFFSVFFSLYNVVFATNINNNKISENEFENSYLFDTTDSIITTKTNLDRNIPQTYGKYSREEYPIPNVSKPGSSEKFELIKEENIEIMQNVKQDIENGNLRKHISADGQFYGSISNDVKAVEKIAYINTNLKGSHSLGVYAPAGEVITVNIPQEFMYLAESGKLSLRVGLVETNADNYSKNNGNENRMPRLGISFTPTTTQTKMGSPFGGMIYVFIATNTPDGLTIPITVTGAVDTPYYDLGSTTNQEWDELKNAPGLYSEFRTPYVRFMMPSSTIRNIDDPYKVLSFWFNVASLSTYSFGAQGRTLPITMVFDPYVAVGAAYATVGAWICNMPTSWATSSLNYDSIMKEGCWGTIHEFNHHWQGTYNNTGKWGVGEPSEVTNNVMNAASYILYTNISSYRTISGLDGWSAVSDPYSNLKAVLNESKNNQPLTSVYMYTSFMHEFGVENYLEIIKSNYFGGIYNNINLSSYNPEETRYDDLAYRTCVVLGKDLSYYFTDILHFDLKQETIKKIKDLNFEQYIPVQNIYSVGPKDIETGRPFYIPNTNYTFDFNKYMSSPGNVEIINVSNPKYGTMQKKDNGIYEYIPNKSLPQNSIDEFELNVKISANGISQNRTLICKIGIDYNYSKIEKFNINIDNTNEAINLSKTIEPYTVSYNSSINYSTDNGYNLTKGSGYLTIPSDGEYEFQAYGDDKISFILSVDGEDYNSTTNTYTNNVNNAYTNKNSTHFSVYLKANIPYSYTLYTNNRGGNGQGNIAYRKNSTTNNFININNIYLNMEDIQKSTDKTFELPNKPFYTRPLTKIKNNILVDMTNAKILSNPRGQSNDGSAPESIIDGNKNTFFHSKYSGSNITPFPHEYIIDLGDIKSFNRIDIYTRSNNGNGTIGDYEIYISNEYLEDKTDWKLLSSVLNRKGNNDVTNNIINNCDLTNARYVKIKALNNRYGNNFTIISEIELSTQTSINSKIAQNSSQIIYNGNWERKKDGNYINGATYNSLNGKLYYGFKGTETGIYSAKDTTLKIKVDNNEEKIISIKGSKYSPSLILNGYNNTNHSVEVEVLSGEFALNMLSTDGIFIQYEKPEIPIPPTEELFIKSSTYNISENRIITKILPNTTTVDFKSKIETNAKIIKFLDTKGNEITGNIYTGLILELNEETKYTLIVTGDLNKDGNLDIVDLSILNKSVLGLKKLDSEQMLSGDLNFDNTNDIVDLSILNKIILGIKKLEF